MNWARALRRVVPPAFRRIDADMLEELEERLITADFGVQASMRFVDLIEKAARRGAARDEAGLRTILRDAIRAVFDGDGAVAPEQVDEAGSADAGSRDAGVPDATACLAVADTPPTVYLVVGVNGVGKTTTTGKLAHLLAASGRSVMLAAADTFRAGAVEQLERWAERAGADFIRGQPGGDPAAVAFDAIAAARARGTDIVLIDTAGRLHTHGGLMEQLAKVDRVTARNHPGAPHETLLVLDATVGQNGLVQAREFSRHVAVTGIVLAKLDSTARGGIVVALREELGIPVRMVGTGERPDDLKPFDADEFVEGVLAARG